MREGILPYRKWLDTQNHETLGSIKESLFEQPEAAHRAVPNLRGLPSMTEADVPQFCERLQPQELRLNHQ